MGFVKYIPQSEVVYQVTKPTMIYPRITNRKAISAAREAGFTITRTLKTDWVQACSWCRSRPAVWEMDCDGWHCTTRCDAPQCREGYFQHIEYEGPKPSYY